MWNNGQAVSVDRTGWEDDGRREEGARGELARSDARPSTRAGSWQVPISLNLHKQRSGLALKLVS